MCGIFISTLAWIRVWRQLINLFLLAEWPYLPVGGVLFYIHFNHMLDVGPTLCVPVSLDYTGACLRVWRALITCVPILWACIHVPCVPAILGACHVIIDWMRSWWSRTLRAKLLGFTWPLGSFFLASKKFAKMYKSPKVSCFKKLRKMLSLGSFTFGNNSKPLLTALWIESKWVDNWVAPKGPFSRQGL